MKKVVVSILALALFSNSGLAAEYVIDGSGAGMHASVHFKASHVGISTLWGRFNDITGRFTYDAGDIEASSIEVEIDPASIDTNHDARDEHLRSSDYLDVEQYPAARFVSTAVERTGEGTARVTGDFTLHGVTREITIDVQRTGEGMTPFGDYRVGFEGQTEIDLADYNISLVPSTRLELRMAIEGVRR